MAPADALPLLEAEAQPSPASEGRRSSRRSSRARDWGESSYTDLHSLASGSDDGRGPAGDAAPSRNALGTVSVRVCGRDWGLMRETDARRATFRACTCRACSTSSA